MIEVITTTTTVFNLIVLLLAIAGMSVIVFWIWNE